MRQWLLDAARCGAKTRREPPAKVLRCPGRCRMHGGKSPGAPKGNRNPWKHGHYSAESVKLRRYVQVLARLAIQTSTE